MTIGGIVFAADGARIGQITAIDEATLTVRGDDGSYQVPVGAVAYEEGEQVFLHASGRAAARRWRNDVLGARMLRRAWERFALARTPRRPGGRLTD